MHRTAPLLTQHSRVSEIRTRDIHWCNVAERERVKVSLTYKWDTNIFLKIDVFAYLATRCGKFKVKVHAIFDHPRIIMGKILKFSSCKKKGGICDEIESWWKICTLFWGQWNNFQNFWKLSSMIKVIEIS